MAYEFDVTAHNAAAEVAQRDAGVDPDRCISLEEIPGGGRTPIERYFSGLRRRLLAVPKDSQPRHDGDKRPWREHDGRLHVRRVGALHPDLVDLVVSSSVVGEEYLIAGKTTEAEVVGRRVDYFLANKPIVWRDGLRDLIAITSGATPVENMVPVRGTDAEARLIQTQVTHFARLQQVAPGLFDPVFAAEGYV